VHISQHICQEVLATEMNVSDKMKTQNIISLSLKTALGNRKRGCILFVLLLLVIFQYLHFVGSLFDGIERTKKKNTNSSMAIGATEAYEAEKSSREEKSIPIIEKTDTIITNNEWTNAIVVEEYKLIFFPVPKVASSEWKQMFRAMGGLREGRLIDLLTSIRTVAFIQPLMLSLTSFSPALAGLNDPDWKNEGLKRLFQFPLEDVQEMMTNTEWTRAVMVREPKERILSAFLNKFVKSKSYFYSTCCRKKLMPQKSHRHECRNRQRKEDFTFFLYMTQFCLNPHWLPQRNLIDEKWWPYITFIGYLHNGENDARHLLQSVRSSRDNITAWEKFGHGWGESNTEVFMSSPALSYHRTNAREKMAKYYSLCDEIFVEQRLAADWGSPYFHFDKFELHRRSRNMTNEMYLRQCGLLPH
jgi:hypothetical protein